MNAISATNGQPCCSSPASAERGRPAPTRGRRRTRRTRCAHAHSRAMARFASRGTRSRGNTRKHEREHQRQVKRAMLDLDQQAEARRVDVETRQDDGDRRDEHTDRPGQRAEVRLAVERADELGLLLRGDRLDAGGDRAAVQFGARARHRGSVSARRGRPMRAGAGRARRAPTARARDCPTARGRPRADRRDDRGAALWSACTRITMAVEAAASSSRRNYRSRGAQRAAGVGLGRQAGAVLLEADLASARSHRRRPDSARRLACA